MKSSGVHWWNETSMIHNVSEKSKKVKKSIFRNPPPFNTLCLVGLAMAEMGEMVEQGNLHMTGRWSYCNLASPPTSELTHTTTHGAQCVKVEYSKGGFSEV